MNSSILKKSPKIMPLRSLELSSQGNSDKPISVLNYIDVNWD